MLKSINIVSFHPPYPPNYGGVIDVFYKLKYLKLFGLKIYLHFFYNKDAKVEFDKISYYCDAVYSYERKKGIDNFFSFLPYIVISRGSIELIRNLRDLEFPIIFEGIHTTYPVYYEISNESKINFFLRAHNVEHKYYSYLFKNEKNFSKKLYFFLEALKLKYYESIVNRFNSILTISEKDFNFFKKFNKNTFIVYPFHKYEDVWIKIGLGEYILVHGNFLVNTNLKSLRWLIKNVLSKVKYKVIIAGKLPNNNMCNNYENIFFINNPTEDELEKLIENSQINIIHSSDNAGFKIKLLYSLFRGRFCICNSLSISDKDLLKVCYVVEKPAEYICLINELMNKKFDYNDLEERKKVLKKFSNIENVKKLIQIINGDFN